MKSIITYFVRNPIVAYALILICLLLGVFSYFKLPISALPPLHVTNIEIDDYYQGGNPQFIEKSITTPMESALATVQGVETMTSQSEYGASFIHLVLKPKVDLNKVMRDIQSAVSQAKGQLPKNLDPPVIGMNTGSSADVLMVVGAYDNNLSPLNFGQYIDRHVLQKLQNIPGISQIRTRGLWQPAIQVWMKPDLMHAFNVTPTEVLTAINAANKSSAGGLVEGHQNAYAITVSAEPKSAKSLANIVIKQNGQDKQILLKDVATINVLGKRPTESVRVNGHQGIVMEITPSIDANYLSVAKQVKATLSTLAPTLPSGMVIKPIIDSSNYIKHSIGEIYRAILEAILLVSIVVLFFLRKLRLAIIPIITIPVCLVSCMLLFLIMGYGINIMTLLALILSIGLIVDDAVIVVENIFRHMRAGATAKQASISGTHQISFAIIAMTCTLAVVYAPIALSSGFTGDLIKPFAFTLSALVIISGILSLTVTPAMYGQLLQGKIINHRENAFYSHFRRYYLKYLGKAIRTRWLVVGGLVVILVLSLFLLGSLKSELSPAENYGTIETGLDLPANSSSAAIQQALHTVERSYASFNTKGNFYSVANFGDHDYSTYYSLNQGVSTPWTSHQLASLVNDRFKNNADFVTESSPFSILDSSATNNDMRMIVTEPSSYADLNRTTQHFINGLKNIPGVADPRSYLNFNNKQLHIDINGNLASDLGLTKQQISASISLFYADESADNDMVINGMPYKILLSLPPDLKSNLDPLKLLWLKSQSTGKLVPAADVISSHFINSPHLLAHYDRIRSAVVRAKVLPGFSMQSVMQRVEGYSHQTLPKSASFNWSGGSLQFIQANHNLQIIILLGLLSIYLVLVLQFKSFIDPLIILLTVPLSFFGALLTLKIMGGTFNIYTQVGLLTLIGLISKQGILIIDFANKARSQGYSALSSILRSTAVRLRPILMTTIAMIIGALPLALVTGPGTNALHQIAWVIIGGMLFGSILSLFAVPIVYLLISGRRKV